MSKKTGNRANSALMDNVRVTIIQRVLPHYRLAFFRRLHARLSDRNIDLNLVYGQELPGTVPRTVALDETWARRIENRYIQLAGRELVWQPCLKLVRDSKLVVIEQSSRLLVNYPLFALRNRRRQKVAFWGHGRNMQSEKVRSLSERLKQLMLGRADWWFAYTAMSGDIVAASDYPRSRITDVQNAIDTSELKAHLRDCSEHDVLATKHEHSIVGDIVALYCGGLNDFKKLPFLMDACVKIKKVVPGFQVVFVGDGPRRALVVETAARHDWMHYVGAKFGRELAPYYRMSTVLLMPGAVGLAIIDSFVAEVPLFTTDLPIHGPEIAYLDNGLNGMMTTSTAEAFAATVAKYLKDTDAQRRLKEGCARSAEQYTLENMVENFAAGIEKCLGR